MKLVRFLSADEKNALEEGRILTEPRCWGEFFPGTTSYGKCFLEGDSRYIKPNDAIGLMRRDRFLSFLSSAACDYDFALQLEGEESDISSLFTKEKGSYPNNITLDEWCIQSISLTLFKEKGIRATFIKIPHFESGY